MEFTIETSTPPAESGFDLRFSQLSEKEKHYLNMLGGIPDFHCQSRQETADGQVLHFDNREELEKFAFFLAIAKEVADHFPTHSLRRRIDSDDEPASGSGMSLY